MAKELVLIPKIKYEELLSKSQDDKISENNSDENRKVSKGDNEENNSDEITKDDGSIIKSNDKMLKDQPKKSLRRSMRKNSQHGGKLYIKERPVNFMRAVQTERKWLSFKL